MDKIINDASKRSISDAFGTLSNEDEQDDNIVTIWYPLDGSTIIIRDLVRAHTRGEGVKVPQGPKTV